MAGPTEYDALQNRITNEADAARDYISNVTEPFKSNALQTVAALQLASREYDTILKAKSSKPLFGEIFINLIVTILPAANLIKKGGELFTLGKKAKKAVDFLNENYVDLVKAFKDPITEQNEQNEDQTKDQNQYAASNDAIRKEMTDLFELVNKIDELARNSRKYIRMKVVDFQTGKDTNVSILPKIKADFKNAGLDKIKKVGADEFNLLVEQLLYDMLKKYVSTYVIFKIGDSVSYLLVAPNKMLEQMQSLKDRDAIKSGKVSDLPEARDESFIEGMDLAQRKAVYARFGISKTKIPMSDYTRYSIDDYKDMIKRWGAVTKSISSDKIIRWNDVK